MKHNSNLLREGLAKEMGFKFGFKRYDSWTRSNRKREGVTERGAVHRKCPVTVCFSASWWCELVALSFGTGAVRRAVRVTRDEFREIGGSTAI